MAHFTKRLSLSVCVRVSFERRPREFLNFSIMKLYISEVPRTFQGLWWSVLKFYGALYYDLHGYLILVINTSSYLLII
jgi:hypothetical protein